MNLSVFTPTQPNHWAVSSLDKPVAEVTLYRGICIARPLPGVQLSRIERATVEVFAEDVERGCDCTNCPACPGPGCAPMEAVAANLSILATEYMADTLRMP